MMLFFFSFIILVERSAHAWMVETTSFVHFGLAPNNEGLRLSPV